MVAPPWCCFFRAAGNGENVLNAFETPHIGGNAPVGCLFVLLLALPAAAIPVDKLQDRFGGTAINSTLWTVTQIQGTASASGTTLDLVPNANTGTASILVSSTATYSLAGSEASVNVSRVPSSAGGVDAQFSLFLCLN